MPNYFNVVLVDDVWAIDGIPTTLRYYHRPLEAIVAPLLAAGFGITALQEPHLAVPATGDEDPDSTATR